MDIIKQIIKFTLYMLLLFIFFIFILYITKSSTKYHCQGNQNSELTDVYIEFQTHSPITKLWADSIGDIKLEIPGITYEYYPRLKDLGATIWISDFYDKSRGTYYKTSNGLTLKTDVGKFNGICKKTNE